MTSHALPALNPSPSALLHRERASFARVIRVVAKAYRIPISLIINDSRCRANAAHARQVAMYLAHVVLGQSLTHVGAVFGRDRTTVSYACAQIEDLRDDAHFDAELCRLEAQIEGRAVPHEH